MNWIDEKQTEVQIKNALHKVSMDVDDEDFNPNREPVLSFSDAYNVAIWCVTEAKAQGAQEALKGKVFNSVTIDEEVNVPDVIVQKLKAEGAQEALAKVEEIVKKYEEFARNEHLELLETQNTLIAFDMHSRMVASKHILERLQQLKDNNTA